MPKPQLSVPRPVILLENQSRCRLYWPWIAGGLVLLGMLVAGLVVLLLIPWGAVTAPEVRPGPRTAEEAVVYEHLRARAQAAGATLEFDRWGPHEVVEFQEFGKENRPAMRVRVRYKDSIPQAVHLFGEWGVKDALFTVVDGRVVGESINLFGDGWNRIGKKKAFP